MTKELTKGQELVGLDFNPNSNKGVHNMKLIMANAIDLLYHETSNSEEISSGTKSAMIDNAIKYLVTAQMWAVKAITWKDE